MHKEFLKLLEKATGRSEHVIVINLDIRGFTSFCQSVAPLDIATYIKKVYLKIIKDYFKNAKYYKPTGDGLILIIPFTEETLKEVTNSTVKSCLELLERFGSLCDDEPMINYPTPPKIGIGLTRGSACCLTSEDKILDYSGRILNLASRLMELARPSGIVFDDSFGVNLLEDETKELFDEETGYLRGVAEEEPIRVHYARKHTLLPESFRNPLKKPRWETTSFESSLQKLKKSASKRLRLPLAKSPLDESKIVIHFVCESPGLEGWKTHWDYYMDDPATGYKRVGNAHIVNFERDVIVELLEARGIPEDTTIRIDVIYPVE